MTAQDVGRKSSPIAGKTSIRKSKILLFQEYSQALLKGTTRIDVLFTTFILMHSGIDDACTVEMNSCRTRAPNYPDSLHGLRGHNIQFSDAVPGYVVAEI